MFPNKDRQVESEVCIGCDIMAWIGFYETRLHPKNHLAVRIVKRRAADVVLIVTSLMRSFISTSEMRSLSGLYAALVFTIGPTKMAILRGFPSLLSCRGLGTITSQSYFLAGGCRTYTAGNVGGKGLTGMQKKLLC